MDAPITMDDVEVKPSTVYTLWNWQNEWMAGKLNGPELLEKIDSLES
jgi:hypothetical protein